MRSPQTGLAWSTNSLIYPYKLLMHPANPAIMYLASSDGIYKTTDGWATSTQLTVSHSTDIEFRPGRPDTLYASTTNSVLYTTNGGISWSNLSSLGIGLPMGEFTRIELGVSPAAPSSLYALITKDIEDNGYIGLYLGVNDANTFFSMSDSSNTQNITGLGNYNQTWWDLGIAIDPLDEANVFIGGMRYWRSLNYGLPNSWEHLANYGGQNIPSIHPDIHDIWYDGTTMLVATDGGLAKSTDGGNTWTDLSGGLDIMQFYDIDVKGISVMGGTQDNGTNQWDIGEVMADRVLGGDGFEVMFHPSNSNIWYASTQDDRWKSVDAGNNWNIISPPSTNSTWDASWIMHPQHPDTMYTAKFEMYRTYNGGANWVALNAGFSNALLIRAMAQGVDNPDVLYASDRKDLRKTENLHNSPPVWDQIDSNLPSSPDFGGIALDPSNSQRVWVTYVGYTAGRKVYYSPDGGSSWLNISGSLPNVPVRCIAYQQASNDGLYIGTDLGVFYRNGAMSDWIFFGNSLPNTRVEDLKITNTYVYAGTHGRGIWRSLLYSTCPVSIGLPDGGDPNTGIQYVSASHSISSAQQITGGMGTDVTYNAGNYIRLDPGFEVHSHAAFHARTEGCPE